MELLDGVLNFKKNDFSRLKEHFNKLKNSQKPHTLFIACSDSRLVPNMITSTLPGELFVLRNIANIIPKFDTNNEFSSVTSSIEYAINQLNVKNIVICGHSNCGGCTEMWNEQLEKTSPHTFKWLKSMDRVKASVNKYFEGKDDVDPRERNWVTEQYNIVEQMYNIFTYPNVETKYMLGELNIHGWYYVIETGEVYSYNSETEEFELINDNKNMLD